MAEGERRFLAEWHLQKIARWLTLFGYPTEVVKRLDKQTISKCAGERCTVLTTSRRWEKTFKNFKVDYLLLPNDEDWLTVLCLVLRSFNLEPVLRLNYCPICLGRLVPISAEEVKGKIPYYSYRCGKNFKICPSCGKIYWIGGHQRLMEKTIKRLEKRCRELFKV